MNYVYVITCLANQKQYVGETKDPEARKRAHLFISPNRSPERRQVIHEAVRKHGVENFKFEVVSEHLTEEEAFAEEHRLILQKRSEGIDLYNMNDGGEGGINPGEETRKKMSKTRISLLEEKKLKTGSKFSDGTRKKISEAAKQQFSNPAARDFMSNNMKSRWNSWSDDQKAHHIERLVDANRNRRYDPVSEETKQKISDSLRQRADEKGRAKDNIIDLVHNCPDCGKEVKRKGVAGWKSQIKAGRCRSCNAKEGHKTKRLEREAAATVSLCDSSDQKQ